jgi:zinc D-Ala-D-Ala carboxypeptidase
MNYSKGMTGTSIKVIQAKLLSMGYYGGKIDGVFGTETERGVKLYQAGVDGLVVDGIVGGKTLNALNGSFRLITLSVQRKLNRIGYRLRVDGDYGDRTRAAVHDYQRKHHIPAGPLDRTTYGLIDKEVAQSAGRLLKFGSHGEDVRALQKTLNNLHFLVGTVGLGGFGFKTRDAVKRLQNAYLLSADGIVGAETYEALGRNGQLSAHFNIHKDVFYSRGNGNLILDGRLVVCLEKTRHILGDKPLHLNSVYRDPKYNFQVGGASKSQHKLGKAADAWQSGVSPAVVAAAMRKAGFTYIQIYPTFTHGDVR